MKKSRRSLLCNGLRLFRITIKFSIFYEIGMISLPVSYFSLPHILRRGTPSNRSGKSCAGSAPEMRDSPRWRRLWTVFVSLSAHTIRSDTARSSILSCFILKISIRDRTIEKAREFPALFPRDCRKRPSLFPQSFSSITGDLRLHQVAAAAAPIARGREASPGKSPCPPAAPGPTPGARGTASC